MSQTRQEPDRRTRGARVGAAATDAWLSVARTSAADRLDPHNYAYGVNGLTVSQATQRAFGKVLAILERSGEEYTCEQKVALRRTIGACIISQVRRDNLYRIAGILVADRRDEGVHVGRSLLDAYVEAIRKVFLAGISVGEAVESPEGQGEVRYVSADGSNAVVALYGEQGAQTGLAHEEQTAREIFCATGVLSRLHYDLGAVRDAGRE